MLEFTLNLALELRKVVEEALEQEDAGEVVGRGASGEETKRVDRIAEEFVVEALEGMPVHIVTEESGVHGDPSAERVAVVDPLDGTFNALHGLPFYAFSIAFAPYSREAGLADIDFALVMNLASGGYFHAQEGKGSYLGERRIRVKEGPLNQGTMCIYSTVDKVRHLFPLLESSKKMRTMGSAALELCHLAKGDFQLFVDNRDYLRNVDVAAALLILEEAGGVATDMEGRELDTGILDIERLNLFASSSRAHAHALSLLGPRKGFNKPEEKF